MAKTRRTPTLSQTGMQHPTHEEEVETIVNKVHEKLVKDRAPRSNWGIWMQAITMVVACIGFIFSLGITYSRLAAAETRLAALEKKQESAETQLGQLITTMTVTVQKIDDLRSTVSEIKGQLAPTSAGRGVVR